VVPRNNFEIIGLKELIKAFEQFGDIAVEELRKKVDEAGEILLEATKAKVPVKSGKLRDSLYLKRPTSKKWVIANILTWGDDVRDYAAPLELGHHLVFMGHDTDRRVPAYPFLRPAADESREKVFKIIIEGFDNSLEKLGGLK
jgi:HK97 gp10 family phage protein